MTTKQKVTKVPVAFALDAMITALEDVHEDILASAYGEDGIECDWTDDSVKRFGDIFDNKLSRLRKQAAGIKKRQSRKSER